MPLPVRLLDPNGGTIAQGTGTVKAPLTSQTGQYTVVVGGVIPPDDVATLKDMGAAAVYPPGTVIAPGVTITRVGQDRYGRTLALA